jgi:hypothetical protein
MTSKQADGRFLRGVLVALIVATLASGTVAGVAMVRHGGMQDAGSSAQR